MSTGSPSVRNSLPRNTLGSQPFVICIDPPEWNKFVTIRQDDGTVKAGDLPFNYWLLPPYESTYEDNYRKHCGK